MYTYKESERETQFCDGPYRYLNIRINSNNKYKGQTKEIRRINLSMKMRCC